MTDPLAEILKTEENLDKTEEKKKNKENPGKL